MTRVDKVVKGRLFIVGSARSGTTLLQAMLAKHSHIYSFPESHFFCGTIRDGRRKRWLALANVSAAKSSLKYLIQLVGRKSSARPGPRWDPRIKSFAKAFQDVVDFAAIEHGKPVWVEKTPHHIDRVDEISKFVKGAKFIHILRDGRDVVASQYHARQQDSEYWQAWSIEQMAQSWGRDVSISLSHLGAAAHFFVSYSALTADPEAVLKSVCEFADLDFELGMLNHWEAADMVLGGRKNEPWMQQVYKPIKQTHLVKFKNLFTPEQQDSVVSHLRFGGDINSVFMAEYDSQPVISEARV